MLNFLNEKGKLDEKWMKKFKPQFEHFNGWTKVYACPFYPFFIHLPFFIEMIEHPSSSTKRQFDLDKRQFDLDE